MRFLWLYPGIIKEKSLKINLIFLFLRAFLVQETPTPLPLALYIQDYLALKGFLEGMLLAKRNYVCYQGNQ